MVVALTLSTVGATASHVSTEPAPRNLLFEEFTGIHCSYCPQGHAKARMLQLTYPGRVYAANIHTGSFATPGSGELDFRLSEGAEICGMFGIQAFPGGVMNRTDVDGRKDLYINTFMTGANQVLAETDPAAVNLWAECSYDGATRSLTVNAEAYFLADVSDARMVVYLLQNDITGTQTGAPNVTAYQHQHALRAVPTGVDGEALTGTTAGATLEKTFTYSVPEDIKGIAVDPSDLEVLVFVTGNPGAEVLNVTGCFPAYTNFEPANTATFTAPIVEMDTNWACDYYEGYLDNKTNEAITSATFLVTHKTNTATAEWSGEVPAHTSQLVRVPIPSEIAFTGKYTRSLYKVELQQTNGVDVENPTRISGNISTPKQFTSPLNIRISTDANPAQDSYRLVAADGTLVAEFGPYEARQTVTETVDLAPGRYSFEVFDKGGDAITSTTPVEFLDADFSSLAVLTSGKGLDSFGGRQGFSIAATESVDSVTAEPALTLNGNLLTCPGTEIALYRMDGTLVACGRDTLAVPARGAYVAVAGSRTLKVMR